MLQTLKLNSKNWKTKIGRIASRLKKRGHSASDSSSKNSFRQFNSTNWYDDEDDARTLLSEPVCSLNITKMSELDLSESDLSESDLSESDLSESDLSESDLSELDLS